MNYTTFNRIIARATYELNMAGISTSTNFESAINAMVKLHIDDDPPLEKNGWIRIFVVNNHLTFMFGNVKSGKNFIRIAAKPETQPGKVWIPCWRESLSVTAEKNKLFSGAKHSRENCWDVCEIGGQNV